MSKHTAAAINERRQKLWTLLTRGMKTHEIAKELNTDHSTISRDIKYLTAQSNNYLTDLAKSTLPFMHQTSIEGILDSKDHRHSRIVFFIDDLDRSSQKKHLKYLNQLRFFSTLRDLFLYRA